MLPDKLKDETELENAGKFTVKLEPEDVDSHEVILREDMDMMVTEADNDEE